MSTFRSFLTLLFGLFVSVSFAEPPKTALLVAVSDYPMSGGWQALNAHNDIILIKDALMKQGFKEEEIVVIEDQEATRDGILSAIRTHLVQKARPGGIAYFHFSGHGQQVFDNDNGDEVDGYDEAIVPVDSPLEYDENGYKGENLIRDDELGQLFVEVRRKLGPSGNMQVVLDACHSGTGTRGFGVARGTTVKMAPSGYSQSMQSRGSDNSTMEAFGAMSDAGLAPMVAFFGAAHNQLNFETIDEEGRNVGSLSYAFSKKFAEAKPSTTYRGLFEEIKLEMSAIAPRQTPQVEGTLDQEIMGGQIVGAPEYYKVKRWNDPGSVTINAGWLQGVHEGSIVAFYPPETRDVKNAQPIAKGEIVDSQPTTANVYLDESNDLDQETADKVWVFVLEKGFGQLKVSFRNDLPEGHPVTPVLNSRIEGLPIQQVEEMPDLVLLTDESSSRGAQIKLITNNDIEVGSFSSTQRSEFTAQKVLEKLKSFAQARFLKNLEMTSYELPVEFEIVPVQFDERRRTAGDEIPLEEKMDAAGTVRLNVGDVFKVRVTNNGYKSAYFTLIDIQPDNVVNILIPDARETPDEFIAPPGKTIEVPRLFQIGEPYGMEVFKLIATDEPVDLRPMASHRGESKPKSNNPFERLFGQTYFNEDCQSRGGKTIAIGASDLNVNSFTFIIE